MSASRSIRVIGLLLLLAAAGFFGSRGVLHWRCEKAKSGCRAPEIAWLRSELQLDDDTFRKVEELHLAYQPSCCVMCDRIRDSGKRLHALARDQRSISPALESAMADDEKVRAECRLAMLKHLYETARVMQPHQADRFLEIALPAVTRPEHSTIGEAVSH